MVGIGGYHTDKVVGAYHLYEMIGSGTYGTVYKANVPGDRTTYAIKEANLVYNHHGENIDSTAMIETSTISVLDHPNIIKMIGSMVRDKKLYMISLYHGPSLYHVVVRRRDVPYTMYQLFSALAYMEECGVVHRDIKPSNIVMDGNIPVIIDFGSACMGKGCVSVGAGTISYRAPSLFLGDTPDNRVDIWAMGVVMYETITGKNLFKVGNEKEYLSSLLSAFPNGREWYDRNKEAIGMGDIDIKDGPYLEEIFYKNGLSDIESSFLLYIFQLDREDIPSAKMCLEHEYFSYVEYKVYPPYYGGKKVERPYPYPMITPYPSRLRVTLIKWMSEISEEIRLDDTVLYAGIILFDRFQKAVMGGTMGPSYPQGSKIEAGKRIPNDDLHICGMVCIYLAHIAVRIDRLYAIQSFEVLLPDEISPHVIPYSIFIYETLGYNLFSYIPTETTQEYVKSLVNGSIMSTGSV
jgi:serine/threonine protein kinase